MSRRGRLPMFFSVAGLALALGANGCSGSTPRDIRYGTDAEADFDAPPEPVKVDGGDAGDVVTSDAGDLADASDGGSVAPDAGVDSEDTATDGTGN
jgi:hypothetical protein